MLRLAMDADKEYANIHLDPEYVRAPHEERRKRWPNADNLRPMVEFNDVLAEVYGWTPLPPRYPDSVGWQRLRFSKQEIGQKKYMAAYMAVRKAAKRLEARGLVRMRGNSTYEIAKQGRELMAKLADPRSMDRVEMRYLKDVNLLSTGEYMHSKGKIIEVTRYEAERMLRSGVFEMV
jgi:hypothetical protein